MQRETFWQRITKIHVLLGWKTALYIWLTKTQSFQPPHFCVHKKLLRQSSQIIKVCNSTAIVLFASQNFLHEWINVRWRPEKLQSNNCHLRDDDRQAEPKLHILSNNQGAHEGINSIHLSVENDSEVMSCYYQ